jgi:hypothetical protein
MACHAVARSLLPARRFNWREVSEMTGYRRSARRQRDRGEHLPAIARNDRQLAGTRLSRDRDLQTDGRTVVRRETKPGAGEQENTKQ